MENDDLDLENSEETQNQPVHWGDTDFGGLLGGALLIFAIFCGWALVCYCNHGKL